MSGFSADGYVPGRQKVSIREGGASVHTYSNSRGAVVGENLGTKAELGPGTMVEKLAESNGEDEIAKNGVVEAGE